MKTQLNKVSSALRSRRTQSTLLSAVTLAMLSVSTVSAQEVQAEDTLEVIEVSGIRASLSSALLEKRNSTNLVEVIKADDVGKLPDQNLAEVLENITGIQITRTAGVGTGVQIRGTNANRVEINGVSTVGAGAGRNGISFEDINAAIISAVEVTKASEAKTVEGSVGGTINLRTIRPLTLSETLGSVRVQYEDSNLSTQGARPRLSGAYGDNWELDAGKLGFVISASYAEQEAVSFRPRADRDNLTTIGGQEFQGIQFFVQEQENDDYETTNIASTIEFAPNDNLKFHFDAIINKQERSRDSYRLQASGVTALLRTSVPTALETVNYGTVNGVNIGSKQAALIGTLEPNLAIDDDDPNLRFSSDTAARITDTEVFSLGAEWQGDKLHVYAEVSTSNADTYNPNLSTTVNFINPNCPLDGTSNDNCVPFVYDLSGGSLSWGINFDSPFAPSAADLVNPNNVVLQQVQVARNTTANSEDAMRLDFEYFVDEIDFINSVDFGFRYNKSSSVFEDISDNIGSFSRMTDSPNGSLFSELLVRGPSNYGDADGRTLFISDFLLLDPDRSFSDPDGVIKILQDAVIAHDPSSPDILNLTSNDVAFRQIEEKTSALYAQANFEFNEMVRGNIGMRYVQTDIASTGFDPVSGDFQTLDSDYDFILPRFNLVVTPHDDVVVRFGYGKDIRRPNFDQLGIGYNLDTSENSTVALGNAGLEPEEVTSLDLAVEWYFAESAVVSVGYFTKDRTNIFGNDFEGALLVPSSTTTGGLARETNPACPGGGIFNPIVVPNVLGNPSQLGLCVDRTIPSNDPETTTQSGFEFAAQYDLSSFEDDLGWASGFGVIANYTIQDFSGGSVVDTTSGRGLQVLGDVSIPRGLLDFSENAYNFTLYYEKFGLSARMRYTWREAFRTQDFAGGANSSGSSTLSFPVVTADRGQLNASISYDVTENLKIGLEGVNLTEERIDQFCVNENALLCFVGLPDRRLTLGASYRW